MGGCRAVFVLFLLFPPTSCQKCNGSKVESASGLFRLVGLFPVRSAFPSQLSNNSLVWAEAMKYTIEQANRRFGGKDIFGYTFYDTCGVEEHDDTTTSIMDMVLNLTPDLRDLYNVSEGCVCLNTNDLFTTVGIVGPAESSNSIYVHRLTSFEQMAVVSYASTSVELSDKNAYPNFFRTVPSDYYQARFITDVLLHFNWTFVSVMATDNAYGRTGMEVLKNNFLLNNICVGVEANFSINDNDFVLEKILSEIVGNPKARVVILWGSFQPLKRLLLLAQKTQLNDLTWIISEAPGLNPWISKFKRNFNGVILSVLQTAGRNHEFEKYFLNLNYNDSLSNPWLKVFFDNERNGTSFPKTLGERRYLFDFSRSGFVHNAASVLINSLLKFYSDNVPCDLTEMKCEPLPILDRVAFNRDYVKRIRFRGMLGEYIEFNENNDIRDAAYELHLAKGDSNNLFELVGHWSFTGALQINMSKLYSLKNFQSKCSEDCPPGEYPLIDINKACCWKCVECPTEHVKSTIGQRMCVPCNNENDWFANLDRTVCVQLKRVFWSFQGNESIVYIVVVFSLSSICIFMNVMVIATFVKYRDTPVIRSSNFRMSMAQLASHLLLFVYPFIMLGEDTKPKCLARNYVSGTLFVTIIGLTLVKVTHIISVFKQTFRLTKKQVFQMKTREILLILCILLFYVCMILVIENSHPLSVMEEKNLMEFTIYKQCNSEIFVVGHIIYLLVILLLCAVQSFRGRKLPGKYNEAKYIAFAMFSSTLVTIISIPIGISLSNPNDYKVMLSFVNIISNFLILVILYGYKVKIVLFHPEVNTLNEFRKESMASILSSTAAQAYSRQASVVSRRFSSPLNLDVNSIEFDLNENRKSFSREELACENSSQNRKINKRFSYVNECFEDDTLHQRKTVTRRRVLSIIDETNEIVHQSWKLSVCGSN